MTEDGSPSVAVIIPFRDDGGGPRQRALEHLVDRWDAAGYDPVIGQPFPGERWCKSRAIDLVLDETDAEVLVIADADVWCDEFAVLNAVTMAQVGGFAWAVPHGSVYRLDELSTGAIIAGGLLRGRTERMPYRGLAGGGLVVIRRSLYEEAPFDPRFLGWGHEDQAAGLAWQTLGGTPWRPEPAPKLWHLWHPPAPRLTAGVGSAASKQLLLRYIAADRNEDQMRSLIAEAREGVSS